MKLLDSIFILLLMILGCKKQEVITIQAPVITGIATTTPISDSITYLALGDSYTIGQSVPTIQSFPYQLSAQLRLNKLTAADPVIIARTGWTTADLKKAITDAALTKKYSFVTLLIGVNNQFQSVSIDSYKSDFDDLINTAVSYAGGNRKHVFVLSIPDYSVTPFALGRDTAAIRTQIDQYNAINLNESNRLGVNYLNITPISREAKTDNTLLADDGLHPSGKMYMLWVQSLLKQVTAGL
ncbi:MAG: SGNH/GDSL hydrolase family protein [Janthinobacterium lividum]